MIKSTRQEIINFDENVFTFDQDDDQIYSSSPYGQIQKDDCFQKEANIKNSTQQSQQDQKQIGHRQMDVFVFDDEDNEEIKQQQNENSKQKTIKKEIQVQQISSQFQSNKCQFDYLKNKILFKEQNNFVNPKSSVKNQNNLKNDDIMRKPNTMTTNFEKKVRKVRQSIKENQNGAIKNSINFLNKKDKNSNTTQNVSRKSKLGKIQNHFQQFKENETLSRFGQQSYGIQGAKILSESQNSSQQFEYVEQQKAIKVTNLKQFLFTQLSEQYKVNVLIKKVEQSGFLGKLVNKTKYLVTIEQNNKFLFSVTRDSMNKFIFSMNKDDVSQKNKNYLGQLVSKDFSNSEFILYDNGFDPKETKCLEYSYKELAWIKYQQSSGPRKFNVVMSTNGKGFHSIESDVKVLEKKWTQKKQRKNMCKLYSKQPEFDQTDGNFKLDFKGMLGKPSIKNFVLSSEEYEDCLMFARRTEDTYALEVRNPFSLMQAVAICISSIYHKSVF